MLCRYVVAVGHSPNIPSVYPTNQTCLIVPISWFASVSFSIHLGVTDHPTVGLVWCILNDVVGNRGFRCFTRPYISFSPPQAGSLCNMLTGSPGCSSSPRVYRYIINILFTALIVLVSPRYCHSCPIWCSTTLSLTPPQATHWQYRVPVGDVVELHLLCSLCSNQQNSTFPTLFDKMSLHTTQPHQELCLLKFAQKPELVERLSQKKINLD